MKNLLRQRGAALIALAAILVLGMSWMLISALGNASQRTVQNRDNSARVMAEAKAALIGWVAANALDGTENNPGRLPCPQAWGDVGTANEGRAAGNCAATAAGWLPWRTLGISKPLDAAGNQIWYVVSPGWHLPSAGATLVINSNTAGQLTLDGQAAVALLIAPGPSLRIAPIASQVAAGCTARTQNQALNFPTAPNALDFLDCQNGTTADNTFVTKVVDNGTSNNPSPVFNDQVMAVTTADILPTLEAAIAKRIEREIKPALATVYSGATWGFAGANPLYPFAAPFDDPGPGAGTSDFRGSTATLASNSYQGLLPFNQTQGCVEAAANPRCTTATTGGTAFLVFSKSGADTQIGGSGSIRTQSTCAWQSTTYVCTGQYNQPTVSVRVRVNVTNVAMGLRALDLTKVTCTAMDDSGGGIGTQNVPCTATVALQSSGAAILTVNTSNMPDIVGSGWGTYANYMVNIERAAIGDHTLLSSTDATTGWFVRNEWYRLLYYATAQRHAAWILPTAPSCTAGTNCLTVNNLAAPNNNKQAVLILAGRSLGGQVRPPVTIADFLEGENKAPVDTTFEQARLGSTFNDRVVVVSP